VTATRWRRSADARRDEVERRLAAWGFARRFPHAISGPPAALDEPPVLRLRAVLPELGPVFCAFGRYLSARPDLLTEAECQALATIPDGTLPLAPGQVLDLLAEELGRPVADAFGAFDPLPFASTLAVQSHRAQLPGGEPAVVRLARPDLPELLERDLGLLPLLAEAFGSEAMAGVWMGAAVEDFATTVAATADLARLAAALAALAQDGASSGLGLCAPRIVAAASTPRLLTLEDLQGQTADAFAPLPLSGGSWPAGPGSDELAIRLCQIWLRQVRFGQVLPADFTGGDLRILADQRIAWSGEVFAALPPGARENLWEYLLASVAQDPERICAALTREMDGGPQGDPRRLRNRVRQLVPFRDGGWGARDDLAGYLFLHWRSATQEGYRPRPHLVAFYRGLARLAAESRRLAPGIDPLREGLERARLAAGLGDVMRLFDREEMREVLGAYAAALLSMPQRLNEVLTLAAEGRATVKLEMVDPPEERRRKDSSTAALVALLAMVAVVLLAQHIAASVGGLFGPWVERIAAVLLAALGVFLFRGLRRKP
jgi:ubiquinone biosynthesis protein